MANSYYLDNMIAIRRQAFRRLLVLEAGQDALHGDDLAHEAFADIAATAKAERQSLIEEFGHALLGGEGEDLLSESTTALSCIHVLADKLDSATMGCTVIEWETEAHQREVMELWGALQSMIRGNWKTSNALYHRSMNGEVISK